VLYYICTHQNELITLDYYSQSIYYSSISWVVTTASLSRAVSGKQKYKMYYAAVMTLWQSKLYCARTRTVSSEPTHQRHVFARCVCDHTSQTRSIFESLNGRPVWLCSLKTSPLKAAIGRWGNNVHNTSTYVRTTTAACPFCRLGFYKELCYCAWRNHQHFYSVPFTLIDPVFSHEIKRHNLL